MTDIELALQASLDLDITHSFLRMVLADHLEEIGDVRAAGYRAMGRLGLWPFNVIEGSFIWINIGYEWESWRRRNMDNKIYPCKDSVIPNFLSVTLTSLFTKYPPYYESRHDAEDAFAITFAKLGENEVAKMMGVLETEGIR